MPRQEPESSTAYVMNDATPHHLVVGAASGSRTVTLDLDVDTDAEPTNLHK